MKALTLWPEWLPTITHLNKRIENRSWHPGDRMVGQRFALHAGARVGGGSWVRTEWLEETAMGAGWFVEICKSVDGGPPVFRWLAGQTADAMTYTPIHLSAIVATVRLERAELGAPDPRRWAMPDACHWHLADLRVLSEPVRCVGHQGLWNVPDDLVPTIIEREVPRG